MSATFMFLRCLGVSAFPLVMIVLLSVPVSAFNLFGTGPMDFNSRVDPMLVGGPVQYDPHLTMNSNSAIDQGDSSVSLFVGRDLDGDLRPSGTTVDIGADELPQFAFLRGDANADGAFDISDAVYSLLALFVSGSPPVHCDDAGDSNDDGTFDVSDAIYTLSALFVLGSPLPAAPHPLCGFDPTPDSLPVVPCDELACP